MYRIENGILTRDGRKILAIGESYYPSFHKSKFPVPPEGDRIGEMKKDLRMMAEMGINHVRFAALGLTELDENGNMVIDTPLIDAMIEEAEKNDISVSVRLEGYAVNLRNFRDIAMIDNEGTPQDLTVWCDFIQTTMHHDGILEDNVTHARALSEHYSRYPGVVAYQIYNEPHYPRGGFYDYHPCAIEKYRRWLVDKKILTDEEAKTYEPPHSRKEQGDRMWALWRIFSRDSLTAFLDNASDGAKRGADLPTYTCFTACYPSAWLPFRGIDMFANAKSMDIVGYTTYIRACGGEYNAFCMVGDTAQCAAELEGKQSWCIELDSRTYIPLYIFNRNTYATIGSGVKGVVYYQWRGDCPVPGVPYPNSCGVLNYDGSKTANYENAGRMVAFLHRMNDFIMGAHRVHEGIGLLWSDHAVFIADARENDQQTLKKSINSQTAMRGALYSALRNAGYSVSITTAEHLGDNPFGIRVLLIPPEEYLSAEEADAVRAFVSAGGTAYEAYTENGAETALHRYLYPKPKLRYEDSVYSRIGYSVLDAALSAGIEPQVQCLTQSVGVQLLQGDGYRLIVLTNTSMTKWEQDVELRCNFPFTHAKFCTPEGDTELQAGNGIIRIEKINDGGILVLE